MKKRLLCLLLGATMLLSACGKAQQPADPDDSPAFGSGTSRGEHQVQPGPGREPTDNDNQVEEPPAGGKVMVTVEKDVMTWEQYLSEAEGASTPEWKSVEPDDDFGVYCARGLFEGYYPVVAPAPGNAVFEGSRVYKSMGDIHVDMAVDAGKYGMDTVTIETCVHDSDGKDTTFSDAVEFEWSAVDVFGHGFQEDWRGVTSERYADECYCKLHREEREAAMLSKSVIEYDDGSVGVAVAFKFMVKYSDDAYLLVEMDPGGQVFRADDFEAADRLAMDFIDRVSTWATKYGIPGPVYLSGSPSVSGRVYYEVYEK